MKNRKSIIAILSVLLVLSIFLVSVFNGKTVVSNADGFAMGSPVNVTVYGDKDWTEFCNQTIEDVRKFDEEYISHTKSTSMVYKLNNGETVDNIWLAEYLDECLGLNQKHESFTPFCGEFKSLWKIEDGGYVPTSEEIEKALENHKNTKLIINGSKIHLENGKIDLGALGKGTACDRIINDFREIGIENGLVTVGGTVGMIGSPEGKDTFGIGVRNPFGGQNDYFAVLQLTDCFVSTSGDYEKYFERNGVRYSHIFDAMTGKPVQNDISSVTVVADNGMLSDFLSTLIYIEGVHKGFEIAGEYGAEIIIIKKDKSVFISEELQGSFKLKDDSFSVSVVE